MAQFSSPPGATSIPAPFTLAKFAGLTPRMVGASRAELFLRLPSTMQGIALQDLDERIRERADRLWTEMRRTP